MLGLLAGAVVAVAVPTTAIDVQLDVDARTLRGTVEIRIANPTGAPLDRAYVWLYANRFAVPPAGLDDVNYFWVYPQRFSAGSMSMLAVAVAGADAEARAQPHAAAGRGALWAIELPTAVPPGEVLDLHIAYRGVVPERYGTFGCAKGGCTMVGGFYPMLAALDKGGWDLGAPPARTDVNVKVELARPAAVVVSGDIVGDNVRSAQSRVGLASHASLFVAPRWYRTERKVGAATAVFASREPPPPADDARDQILPYTAEDYPRYVLDATEKALELLATIGVDVGARTIVIVEAPLRAQLATAQPGVVAVSDRWYRIWPAKRLRKFHDRQLARAVFAALYAEWLADVESPREVVDSADLVASYLTDLFTIARFDKAETAADILQPVRFLPVIDQVLYAPQLMFADAYFGSVSEHERFREDPARFNHLRPRGRLVYEKLKDLLTPERLPIAMLAIARDRRSVRAAAEAAYGGSLAWFFRQWRRPHPRVNYRLGTLTSERNGAGWSHRLVVTKRVAPADAPPVEPVEIVAIGADGARTRLRWDGRGERAVLEFDTDTRVSVVALDPNRRLVESRLAGDANHALADNRRPSRLRFVYNSFGVLLNVSDFTGLLAADFTLSRVHDLRNRVRFVVFTSAQSKVAASATYTRSFGAAVTPDRLLGGWFASISGRRLRDSFFGEGAPGTELTLGSGLLLDDRVFAWEPMSSRDTFARVSGTLTREDATAGGDARHLLAGTAAAGYTRLATPRGGHTLALDLGSAVVFGNLEQRSQLLLGGGVRGSRGYAPGEEFGRWRVEAHLEYRHVFAHDLNWNFGFYSFLRGVGGTAYVDVVGLGAEAGHGLGGARLLPSVGYGIRLFYDSFGTLQQMMRLDVALRVDDQLTACVSKGRLSSCPAPAVYLTFVPPF